MKEFQTRIAAQRSVLAAIESPVSSLLTAISSKLFFLSNKSQQQITEEYRALVDEVAFMSGQLRLAIAERNGTP
jgi:hypothetical protein